MWGEAAVISRTLIRSTWAVRTAGETTANSRQRITGTQGFQAMDRLLFREPSCLDLDPPAPTTAGFKAAISILHRLRKEGAANPKEVQFVTPCPSREPCLSSFPSVWPPSSTPRKSRSTSRSAIPPQGPGGDGGARRHHGYADRRGHHAGRAAEAARGRAPGAGGGEPYGHGLSPLRSSASSRSWPAPAGRCWWGWRCTPTPSSGSRRLGGRPAHRGGLPQGLALV